MINKFNSIESFIKFLYENPARSRYEPIVLNQNFELYVGVTFISDTGEKTIAVPKENFVQGIKKMSSYPSIVQGLISIDAIDKKYEIRE